MKYLISLMLVLIFLFAGCTSKHDEEINSLICATLELDCSRYLSGLPIKEIENTLCGTYGRGYGCTLTEQEANEAWDMFVEQCTKEKLQTMDHEAYKDIDCSRFR